ncbi:DUF6525 family protein [Albirhodobacter sp. R86504]|uniref:DUF6525 family protein n=1 Tax=Albirhodobacter sp. R86504 TaxID=3093848 RepID=UPI003670FA99
MKGTSPAPRAAMRRNQNAGATPLPRRSRAGDPMQDFDALPASLRHWLTQAARPWSARSCRKIWIDGRSRGESEADVLERLRRSEVKTLQKEAQLEAQRLRKNLERA